MFASCLQPRLRALVLCSAIRTNERRRVLPVLLCQSPPLAHGLSVHLQAQLALALVPSGPSSADGMAAGLLQQLIALRPPAENVNSWVHKKGEKIARTLLRDPELARSLAEGHVSLADAMQQLDARAEAGDALYEAISGHHANLVDRVTENGRAPAEWQQAVSETESLEAYAAAAAEIGKREWARAGIAWCAQQSIDFFHGGGAQRLAQHERRAAARHEAGDEAASGAAAEAVTVEATAAEAADTDMLGVHDGRPIKLLDVGACGDLFAGLDGIESTPLDLCPQKGAARTLQCDFLSLEVGPPGSEPLVRSHARFPAGTLLRMPAAEADVVVMSLVLTYLPQPRQRAAMVAQARRLLHAPPPLRRLLLLVDTPAIDVRARSWRQQHNLHRWVEAVESLGFVFLRHQLLERSHGLAFATAPLTDDELEARLDEAALPELLLRREEEVAAAARTASGQPETVRLPLRWGRRIVN